MSERLLTTEPRVDIGRTDEPVRVLVVDDHPAFLRTVAIVIAATPGFVLVDTAETGASALDSLSTRSDIDLVLLDINLPDISGIDVARRQATVTERPAIVLMSTSDPADLPADAFDHGVAGFIAKELLTTAALRNVWNPSPT